jgi:hypothetical protein
VLRAAGDKVVGNKGDKNKYEIRPDMNKKHRFAFQVVDLITHLRPWGLV